MVHMETIDPGLRIRSDAATYREALAGACLSIPQAGSRLVLISPHGDNDATQLRRQGRLLAVYMGQPIPCYRYPTWQFLPDGRPIDQMAEILTVSRGLGPFEREPEGMRRTTGWGEVEWLLSPHILLGGASPAEALAIGP